jgi:hypothetical protein
MDMPAPGWYEDPVAAGGPLRWWDGTQWTEHTAAANGTAHPAPQSASRATPDPIPGQYPGLEAILPAPVVPPVPEVAPALEVRPGPVIPPAPLVPPVPASPAPLVPASPAPLVPPIPASPAPLVPPVPASPPVVPSAAADPSLTDWFQSIPFPVASRDNAPSRGTLAARDDLAGRDDPWAAPAGGQELAVSPRPARPGDTRVLEGDGTGALAGFGWQHGTPVRPDDTPLLERSEAAGMLRRNRTRLMWGLALGTAVAMLIIGVLVAVLGSGPAARKTAAAPRPSAIRTLAPKARASATPTPAADTTTGTPVADAASGLSYATLASPWTAGCPATMNNGVFTWTAGENAVAGTIASAGGAPWYGSACSGLLGQQYAYAGVADLPQTAMNLVTAFDPTYYNTLPHVRSTEQNNPLQVSGHAAWIVEFQLTYPTAASLGLAWQSQLGAVVVVDRGTGQPPAVLYVTVPDNLGPANVGVILASLQLNAPPAAAAPGASPAATPPVPAATTAAPNP